MFIPPFQLLLLLFSCKQKSSKNPKRNIKGMNVAGMHYLQSCKTDQSDLQLGFFSAGEQEQCPTKEVIPSKE